MNRMLRSQLILYVWTGFLLLVPGLLKEGDTTIRDMDPLARHALIQDHHDSLVIYRRGLESVLAYVRKSPDVFLPAELLNAPMPTHGQRSEMLAAWKSILDYSMALASIQSLHRDFMRLPDDIHRERSFWVFYAAFTTQYRFALDFLDLVHDSSIADTVLNEAVPDMGLPAQSFTRYKYRFLNVATATQFAGLEMMSGMDVVAGRFTGNEYPDLRGMVAEDAERIWRMGRGRGEAMTLKNALDIIKIAGNTVWLPVQTGVANWMGDVRVYRKDEFLISPMQIRRLPERIKPGDILLERREWFLSNIGLPGFWTHAALYVGTPEERRAVFGIDPVKRWVWDQGTQNEDFETLLKTKFPEAYARSISPDDTGHTPRVLEAVAEGVVFTSLEHSAHADSLAVLRPRLPRTEVAAAIAKAFEYTGRPYDYNFDFTTDAELVCSELVYKAYLPGTGRKGLMLPLTSLMGRQVLPPNEIARLFDEEAGSTSRQLDLVLFLDGFEKAGMAVQSDAEAFRQSWQRPKWHVLVQEEAGDPR